MPDCYETWPVIAGLRSVQPRYLNKDVLVVTDDGLHVLVVRLKAVAQLVLCVITALYEAVHDALWRRLELHVVNCVGHWVQPPARHPLNQLLIRHLQVSICG